MQKKFSNFYNFITSKIEPNTKPSELYLTQSEKQGFIDASAELKHWRDALDAVRTFLKGEFNPCFMLFSTLEEKNFEK